MPSRISNIAGFTTSLSSTTDLSVGVITATTLNVSDTATLGDIQISSGIISAVSGVITYFGDASSLTGISAGSSITDDTSTDSSFYPLFTDSTSGILTSVSVSSTKLTFNPSSATLNVGSGVTIAGDGNISIAGTIFASSLSVPVEVSSFDPADGSTVANSVNIIITFNQTVGLGTTGFIELKQGSATGTLIETFYPSSPGIALTSGGTKLSIDPTSSLPIDTIYPIMSSGFITANGSDFAGINTVGSGVSYSFVSAPALGDLFGGGNLICQSGGTRWVAARLSTEVGRTWTSRNDAVTTANASAACGDWFVPTISQLQNPGYVCRTYWEGYTGGSGKVYWSNTENSPTNGCGINSPSGSAGSAPKNCVFCVRAFRCVSY